MSRTVRSPFRLVIASLCLLALIAAACSSDSSDDTSAGSDPPAATDEGSTDGDSSEPPSGGGGGTATLTVGDETYTFDSVLCAVGEQTQSEEWDFSLSAIQDGMQLTVDRATPTGQYGDGIELDDIEDFDNPRVGWSAPPPNLTGAGDNEPFVEVDGKQVTADTAFIDTTSDEGPLAEPVSGTLTATCP
jgi:hypothetical protein